MAGKSDGRSDERGASMVGSSASDGAGVLAGASTGVVSVATSSSARS